MLGAVVLSLPLIVVPALPAAAATWGISKTETSTGPYQPGDNVQFVVTVSCSDPNADPCTNAVVTDPLPDGLELVSASIQSGPTGGAIDADTTTDTVTATWPSVPNGAQAQILITAQVDPDLPYSADGVPITNSATVVADNAPLVPANATITPVVPLVIGSTTTKEIVPEGAIAAPGTPTTMTLSATNTSNDPVDQLVVQDPVDPTATPNPFTYLGYSATGDIGLPPNATTVTEEYWDGDSWEPLDDSVDPTAVQGVRYTFEGDIQPGATATIPVSVVQTDAVEELTGATTVTNDVQSSVVHPEGGQSVPTSDSDTYVITPPNNSVTASKSFDPATVSAGAPTTVTIGATNGGDPTTSLTLTEPSPGTASPFEGDDPLRFTGFGPSGDGTGVQWPANADAAAVTFTCADGATPTLDTTTVGTLPNPPPDCEVLGFSVEFTGAIVTGAQASVPFTADTDPDQDLDDVTHPNEVTATIPNAESTAAADLVTLTDRLATDTDKLITPSTFPAIPGQSVIVQLPSELLPFGPDGSTSSADQVVIQDPTDPSDPGDFWANFSATSVRTTDVPPGSTLTVNYWDGSEWVPAPGCGPWTGPQVVSCDLPAGAEGVQFVYDSTDGGFPPETSFQPNFTAAYDGPTDLDTPLTNCGASSASSSTVAPTDPAEGCASVDPFPVDGAGDLDFLDKAFLGGDPPSVLARSTDQVTAQITWSTNGFSGVDPMVIGDIGTPETTPVASSFYDAFDLVRIEAIDASVDPLMQYDEIESVELYVGGAWVPAAGDPCPCDGSFPGYTLSADESADATAARLTYVESPSRTTDDVLAPQPGDGVARSTQADGRHVQLTFQIRDDRRSDGSPVLGSTNGTLYNTPDAGLVSDVAQGTATFDGEQYTDSDDATVLIIDQPINVGTDKTWTGGPISVPPEGTPAAFYPSTTVTVTGTNESLARVDQLRIVDPGLEGTDEVQVTEGTEPFDAFTLRAVDVSPPTGTETTTVTLTTWDGATLDTATYDETAAEALTVDDLQDVVGVEVAFDGRIASQASGTMTLTLQLRALDRYTGDPVTVEGYSPVPNVAAAQVSDPGGTSQDQPLAWDGADMVLQTAAIDLEVGKTFEPGQVVEPGTGPVLMTLTGQPVGPSRAVEMVLVDDDPQFWNQYDFDAFVGATLTAPIDQVQVDAFTGATFTAIGDNVVVSGGGWETGTLGSTFALPAGVGPEDVQGLRFTFTRADGAIWENPENPLQSVPMNVERREELRTGGPVLPDLADNPPAPGEDAPGVASNTVDGTVSGADQVVDPDTGDLVPVGGTDSQDASVVYVHAENGVQIVKAFDGTVTGGTEAPNAVFPMTIAVTNTGNRPIFDLVVTDPMPVDDVGAQLALADVDEPFTFALTGAAPDPANGEPLPTDPADVTIVQTGDIESLELSFPDDTVLEVGQTYTITVMVQFRLGLPAETVVPNTAGVTGDRPWDECVTRLDADTGACEADADVTSVPAGVLAQSKQVKATDDDELEVFVDPAADPATTCTPDAQGFYSYPCTPVVPPGHDETWRVRIDNVGNLPMTKVVSYDRLPVPGDTGSYSGSDRGSQWEPILTNDPPPVLVNAPAGAVATFFYTTATDYCMADLEDPLNEPTCPAGDPATGWAPLTGTESEEVFETITAMKFVIDFPEDAPFEPGESIAIEGTTTTPAEAPAAGDRSIAYNSAAANAVIETVQGQQFNLLPTEGTKVGVATATGSLDVTKTVTGDGAQYAPDSFSLQVACTSAVGTWLETELDPIPITVTPPDATTVTNLPYGAECTVTEDGSNGETELQVGSVTIGEEPDVVELEAVNVYDLTGLELSKVLDTDAVDQDGDPVPFGPFELTVECTFLGEPVYADGFDPGEPMTVTIDDGDAPVELTGLPVGSECVVTETATGGATSTTFTVTQDGQPPVTVDGSATVVLTARDAGDEVTTAVVVTNTVAVGAIDLLKVVDGDGGDVWGGGPFEIDVTCSFDDDGDGPGDPRTVYDDTVSLGGGDPLEAQVVDLPVGAVCTVTETDDGGATGAVVVPDTVTVGGGEPAQVVITNTFDVGSIVVDKALAGIGAQYATGPWEVSLSCTYEGEPITIPGGPTRELTVDTPARYDDLPVGSECVVTETDDGGATDVEISTTVDGGAPGEVVVTDGDAEITVTNTFRISPVVVRKVVDGDGAQYAAGPWEVTLACTFGSIPIETYLGGPTREITPGQPGVWFGIPDGAVCSITETDDGGATAVSVAPDTVTITEDEIALVTVTNTYDLGELSVEKVVDGDGAQYGTGPFEVSLACTFEGDPVDIPGGATQDVGPGETVTYTDLPVGAECVVSETDAAGATSTTVSTTVVDGEPGQAAVPGDDGDPVLVTVTNTFDLGELSVEKVVDGDGAQYGTGPFEVSLACTFEGDPIEIPGGATQEVGPGETVTFTDLPVGADCVVSETDDGGATSTTISRTVILGGPGATVVPADEADPVVITVTNTYDLGALVVDKVVTGDGADLYGGGPFEVSLSCTFDGVPVEIPDGATRSVEPGSPATYEQLPVGSECVVTEPTTGGATSTTISAVDDGEPGEITVAGEPATVTVTNTFDVGEVRVVKSLSGADAPSHQGDVFTVGLACTQEVDGVTVPVDVPGGPTRTLSQAGAWVAVYEDLPQGATCVVAETDAGSADAVQVVVDGVGTPTIPTATDPPSAQFALPVGDDVCQPVEVINTWFASPGGGGPGAGLGTAVTGPSSAPMSAAALLAASGCSSTLAATGTSPLAPALLGVLLLVTGVLAVLVARRRWAVPTV
ncbi:DUF5979 domain-containing protein [Cellulomonas sp. Leaf334]|uniref:DUF5979 domain-containing protein n=1 Tax=Cellulomonas sp. Leaf334 TaxID=1736339 RepID=UPI0006F4B245|nr:DUF5979 domain-containing protein [Cellulomonas sp. Leaf334]KQR10544.1 hypothetical protein ASF78_17875 [Cellulomonas sp. Leaf334]